MISFFYFEIFCEGEECVVEGVWWRSICFFDGKVYVGEKCVEERAFYTSNSSLNVCK